MPLLEGHDLRKTYRLSKRNVVEALRGVDVTIDSGEMVAIMGPSGSGKSTLMHILGLLHAPDLNDGSAARALVRRAGHGRARRLRADQDPGPRDGLRLPGVQPHPDAHRARERHAGGRLRRHRRRKRAARRRSRRSTSSASPTGPGTDRRSSPAGEQQRVAIARALVNQPEPHPGRRADRQPRLRARPRRSSAILRRLNRERGQTFVLVTHDADVGAACDRIVRMRDGKIRGEPLAA